MSVNHLKNLHGEDSLVGVYWGAFDPPTIAHKAIIISALKEIPLEKIFIIVNNNCYKKYSFSLEDRVEMVMRICEKLEKDKFEVLWQDDLHRLDYTALKNLIQNPLCAIAGYDSYRHWVMDTPPEDRLLYSRIAVVPRGNEIPVLFDSNAFLLHIDGDYRYVSSTEARALSFS